MQISMVRAKLHHARVSEADINYVGSITIPLDLLKAAGLYAYEKVLVVDVENGSRFETYTIPGETGSGIIRVNGAAAHLVNVGDRLIVIAFGLVDTPPPADWQPQVAVLDEHNALQSILMTGNYGSSEGA